MRYHLNLGTRVGPGGQRCFTAVAGFAYSHSGLWGVKVWFLRVLAHPPKRAIRLVIGGMQGEGQHDSAACRNCEWTDRDHLAHVISVGGTSGNIRTESEVNFSSLVKPSYSPKGLLAIV